MIGILVVAHANLGQTLIDTVEFILGGEQEFMMSVSIDIQQNPENLRKKSNRALPKSGLITG